MSQEQNDSSLTNGSAMERAGRLPCITNIIEQGATGGAQKQVMREVAKDCCRQKMDRDAAIDVLLKCNSRNVPPLPEPEIMGLVHSVYTKGSNVIACGDKFLLPYCNKDACRQHGSPPATVTEPITPVVPPPFTVAADSAKPVVPVSVDRQRQILTIDHLPDGWLKDFVLFALPLTEASLQYHLATALTTVATVLGRKVCLCAGASTYYPNLYVVVLGPSGITRKSTAIGLCEWFLPEVNQNYILSGNVMSVEGLLEAFQTSPTHIIVYDELKNLAVNANKSYGRGLISTFTSLWSCPKSLRIDVKKVPPEKRLILAPTLNILAATTMEWLDLKEGDLFGGFWGRFLPIYADTSGEKRLPIRPPPDQVQKERLIGWLRAMNARPDSQYTWQADAQEYYVEIYHGLRDAFDKEPNKSYIGPYWSRIGDHVMKLAMIFDAASYSPTFTITLDNLKRAKASMDIITGYYREMLSRATFSRHEKKEQQVMVILEKACPEWVAHSRIMHDLHMNRAEMKQVMESLEEKEQIVTREVRTFGANKPSKQYRQKS